MSGNRDWEIVLGGIGEGFISPLIEAVVAVIIVQMGIAFKPFENLSHITPLFTFNDLLTWFFILILLEHVILGFAGKIPLAIGYCIGVVFAILLYGNVLESILKTGSNEQWSVIVIILLGVCIRLGIAYFTRNRGNQTSYNDGW